MTATAALVLVLMAPPVEPDTPNVKPTVEKGLKWLAEQQKEDGSWVGRADSQPTSTTAMAGLALLMEGSTLRNGTYAPQLRKAVEWMEKQAQSSGLIVSGNRTELARPVGPHAHALLFLACAYDVDDDATRRKRIGAVLVRGVTYASELQTARGSWSPSPPDDRALAEDPVTTIDMLHALVTVRKAGIDVPRKATDKATEYLVKSTGANGAVGRRPGIDDVPGAAGTPQTQLTAGAAAAVLTLDAPHPSALTLWLRNLHATALQPWPKRATSTALHAQFHMSRVAYLVGESGHSKCDPVARESEQLKWSNYRAAQYRAIQAAQSSDGSWIDTIPGPVYGSALALIILQLDNGYLSAFAR